MNKSDKLPYSIQYLWIIIFFCFYFFEKRWHTPSPQNAPGKLLNYNYDHHFV